MLESQLRQLSSGHEPGVTEVVEGLVTCYQLVGARNLLSTGGPKLAETELGRARRVRANRLRALGGHGTPPWP